MLIRNKQRCWFKEDKELRRALYELDQHIKSLRSVAEESFRKNSSFIIVNIINIIYCHPMYPFQMRFHLLLDTLPLLVKQLIDQRFVVK